MKTIALLLFCSCFSLALFAQKHDQNWMLGDSCGIEFSNQNVLRNLKPNIRIYDNLFNDNPINFTFSDVKGNILGYLNTGRRSGRYRFYDIVDSSGNVLVGGDSIITTVFNLGYVFGIYQKDTIYLFHMGILQENFNDFINDRSEEGCSLYLTKMLDLNGHLLLLSKNQILVDENLTTGIGLTKHSNGSEWWVILHSIDSNETSSYIFSNGVLSKRFSLGESENFDGFYKTYSKIKFARQGNQFAIMSGCGYLELFDFNRCTGEFYSKAYIGREEPYSKNIEHPEAFYGDGFFSCEFSVDAKFFYAGAYFNISQFNLVDYSQTAIYNAADSLNSLAGYYHLELAPNNKIYLATWDRTPDRPPDSVYYLGAIHHPDRPGAACGFEYHALELDCNNGYNSLPHFPNYRLGPAPGYEDFAARPGPPQTYCPSAAPVQLGGAPLPQEATYRWQPETGLNDPFNPSPLAAPDTTTTYTLIVEQCHVSDTATVTVTVLPELAAEAGQDTILCPGGRVRLGPANRSRNLEYAWRPANGLDYADRANPTAAPNRTTTYTLTVLRPGNCDTLASDTVRLEVDELCGEGRIFLPSAFSPNNDGVNDELTVFHENLSTFHLRIFNRWGRLVYETREPDDAWQGNNAPEGVYSYVLQVATEDGRRLQKQGTVTLTR